MVLIPEFDRMVDIAFNNIDISDDVFLARKAKIIKFLQILSATDDNVARFARELLEPAKQEAKEKKSLSEMIKAAVDKQNQELAKFEPAKSAEEANEQARVNARQRVDAARRKRLLDDEKRVEELERLAITIEVEANDEGHISYFNRANIPHLMIEELYKKGFEYEIEDLRKVNDLANLGLYTFQICVNKERDLYAQPKVWIVPTPQPPKKEWGVNMGYGDYSGYGGNGGYSHYDDDDYGYRDALDQ